MASGSMLYTSDSLSELWPFGFSSVGDVTFESAAYVARYIMKKINGNMADDHYFDRDGVLVKPEYTTMSRRSGIGKGWYDKFKQEVIDSDSVVLRGREMLPPKYYDNLLRVDDEKQYEEIKKIRVDNAKLHVDNNTTDRLAVREFLTETRLGMLPRKAL